MARMPLAGLALLLCSASCAVGEAGETSRERKVAADVRCRVDADCIVIHAEPDCGPCGTCPGGPPRACARRWLDAQVRACAEVRRRAQIHKPGTPVLQPPNCSPCPSPAPGSDTPYDAICRSGTCGLQAVDAGAAHP